MYLNSRAMRTTTMLVAALFVVSTFVLAQEQSEEMQIVTAAEQMVNAGQPDEALAELQKIFDGDEEMWQAHFVAGRAYEAKGEAENAFINFAKAAELNPGFGIAHRQASFYAAQMGDLEASWEHAIKAHQSGTDMSDAFAGLPADSAPDDYEAAVAAPRVFVAPVDSTTFQEAGDTALAGGANSAASSRSGRGQRIIQEAAPDIYRFTQEARRQFVDSNAFGLVQRPEQAQYLYIFEVDDMADSTRRRTEGYARLVDAETGEEAFRRRYEFADIASYGDLNRDFSRLMDYMEEWAAERGR